MSRDFIDTVLFDDDMMSVSDSHSTTAPAFLLPSVELFNTPLSTILDDEPRLLEGSILAPNDIPTADYFLNASLPRTNSATSHLSHSSHQSLSGPLGSLNLEGGMGMRRIQTLPSALNKMNVKASPHHSDSVIPRVRSFGSALNRSGAMSHASSPSLSATSSRAASPLTLSLGRHRGTSPYPSHSDRQVLKSKSRSSSTNSLATMVKPDPLHDSHNTSTHSSHSHGPMSISTHTHHAQPPLFLPPLLSPNMLDDHDMFINGNDSDFTDTSVFNSLELGAAMAQLNFPSVPTQMHAFHPVSTPPTASLTPHSNVESMTASFLHALARTQQPPQAPIDHDEHDFDDDDDYHSYDPLGINSLEVVSPINDRSSSSGSVVGTPSAQQHTRAQTNMSEEELRIARLARKAEAARQSRQRRKAANSNRVQRLQELTRLVNHRRAALGLPPHVDGTAAHSHEPHLAQDQHDGVPAWLSETVAKLRAARDSSQTELMQSLHQIDAAMTSNTVTHSTMARLMAEHENRARAMKQSMAEQQLQSTTLVDLCQQAVRPAPLVSALQHIVNSEQHRHVLSAIGATDVQKSALAVCCMKQDQGSAVALHEVLQRRYNTRMESLQRITLSPIVLARAARMGDRTIELLQRLEGISLAQK